MQWRRNLWVGIPGLFMVWLVVPTAYGHDAPWPPTTSERYLALTSQLIVLAEPVEKAEGKLPTRYRVVEVIHHEPVPEQPRRKPLPPFKKNQEFKLALNQQFLVQPERQFVQYVDDRARLQTGQEVKPARIEQALLFLDPLTNPGESAVRLVDGAAVRLLTADSQVLIPYNLEYPKKEDAYHLLPLRGVTWQALRTRVDQEAQEAARLRALRLTGDPAKHNLALLDWLEAHTQEFKGHAFKWTSFVDTNRGWFGYETEVGTWIYETGRIDDCWRLLELADRKKFFAASGGGCYPFRCRAGRQLLMERIADSTIKDSLRSRALHELNQSIWRGSDADPERDPTLADRKKIVAVLLPLLAHKDHGCRATAIDCVERVSLPPLNNRERNPVVRDALDALSAQYKQELEPSLRPQIIRTLLPIADEEHWQKLSGNPQRMGVIFKYYASVGSKQHFFMDLLTGGEPSVELSGAPELVFERMEGNRVVETRVFPTQIANDQGNGNGFPNWRQYGRLDLSVPREKLPSGKWRVRVRGKIASGESWKSDTLEWSSATQ